MADAIDGAVREFAPQLGGEAVALLAVDCHPWNGSLGLSVLTAAEVAADDLLNDPAEMAAWRYYDFARDLMAWRPVVGLGREMRDAYEAGDRSIVADSFLGACAAAVTSEMVGVALEGFRHSEEFRVSVTHPDDGREFVPSA